MLSPLLVVYTEHTQSICRGTTNEAQATSDKNALVRVERLQSVDIEINR
jgi:hypothetical protein